MANTTDKERNVSLLDTSQLNTSTETVSNSGRTTPRTGRSENEWLNILKIDSNNFESNPPSSIKDALNWIIEIKVPDTENYFQAKVVEVKKNKIKIQYFREENGNTILIDDDFEEKDFNDKNITWIEKDPNDSPPNTARSNGTLNIDAEIDKHNTPSRKPNSIQESIDWIVEIPNNGDDNKDIHAKVMGFKEPDTIQVRFIGTDNQNHIVLHPEVTDMNFTDQNLKWHFKTPSTITESLGWIFAVPSTEENAILPFQPVKVVEINETQNKIMGQFLNEENEPQENEIKFSNEYDFDKDTLIWMEPPANSLNGSLYMPEKPEEIPEKEPFGGVVVDKCRNCTTATFKDTFYLYPKDPEATFSISLGTINNAGLMERESYEYKMALSKTENNIAAQNNLKYNFIYFDKVYDPLYQFLDIWKFQMNRQLNPAVYYSGSKRNLNYLVEKFHTIMFQNEKAKEMYKSQLGGLVKIIAANPFLYSFSATKIEKLATKIAEKGVEVVAAEAEKKAIIELEDIPVVRISQEEDDYMSNLRDEGDTDSEHNSEDSSLFNEVDNEIKREKMGGRKKKRGGFFGIRNLGIAKTLKNISLENIKKSIRKTVKNIGIPFLKTRMYRKLQKFYHFKYDLASTAKSLMASVGKIFNKEFFTDKYPFFMKREIIYSLLVAYQTFLFLQGNMLKRFGENSDERKKYFSGLLVANKDDQVEEEVVEEEEEPYKDGSLQFGDEAAPENNEEEEEEIEEEEEEEEKEDVEENQGKNKETDPLLPEKKRSFFPKISNPFKKKTGGGEKKITKKQLEARIEKLETKISNSDFVQKMELLNKLEEQNPKEKYEKTISRLLKEKASKETETETEKIKEEIESLKQEIYKENETYREFIEKLSPDDLSKDVIEKDASGNVIFINTKQLDENIQQMKKKIKTEEQSKEKDEDNDYKRLEIYEAILDNAPDDDEEEEEEDEEEEQAGGKGPKPDPDEIFQAYLTELEKEIPPFIEGIHKDDKGEFVSIASIQDSKLESNIKDAINRIVPALYEGVEGSAFFLNDYVIPVFEDKDFEFDTEGYQKSGLVKRNLEVLDEERKNTKFSYNDLESYFSTDAEKVELEESKKNKITASFKEFGIEITNPSDYITDDTKFKGLVEAIIMKLETDYREIMMISGDSGDSEESSETDADLQETNKEGGSNQDNLNITRKKGGRKKKGIFSKMGKTLKKAAKKTGKFVSNIDKRTDIAAEKTVKFAQKKARQAAVLAQQAAKFAEKTAEAVINAVGPEAKKIAQDIADKAQFAADKAAKVAKYTADKAAKAAKVAAYGVKSAKTVAQKLASRAASSIASSAKSAYTATKKAWRSMRTVKEGFLYAIEIIFQNTYYAMIDRIAVKINTLLQSEVALSDNNPFSAQENVVRFMSNIATSTIMMPMTSCIIPGTPNCQFATGMSMRMISKSAVITNKYARDLMQLFGTVVFKGVIPINNPTPELFQPDKFYAINNVFSGKFIKMDPKEQAPPEENPYREDSGELDPNTEYHTYIFELYEYNEDKTALIPITVGKEKTITVEYHPNDPKKSYVIQEVIPYVYVCPNYYIDREVSVLINNHIETPYFIANIKKDLELDKKGGDKNKYDEMEFEYDNIFLGEIEKVVDTYETEGVTGRLKNMGASIASSASSLYSTKSKQNIAESKTEGRYSVTFESGETEVRVKTDVPLHLVRPYNWTESKIEKEKYKKDIKYDQSHSCFTEEDYSKKIDFDSKNTDSTLQASKNLMPSLFVENKVRKEKVKTELGPVLVEGKKKAEEGARLAKEEAERKAEEEAERIEKERIEKEEAKKKAAQEKAKKEEEAKKKAAQEKAKKEEEAKKKVAEAEAKKKAENLREQGRKAKEASEKRRQNETPEEKAEREELEKEAKKMQDKILQEEKEKRSKEEADKEEIAKQEIEKKRENYKNEKLRQEANKYINGYRNETNIKDFKNSIETLVNLINSDKKDPIPELFSKFNKYYPAELNNFILDKIKKSSYNPKIKKINETDTYRTQKDERGIDGQVKVSTETSTFVDNDSEENKKQNILLFGKIKRVLTSIYRATGINNNAAQVEIFQKINNDFENRMSGGKKRISRRKNV